MIPHYEGLKISWCLVVCNHECFQSTSWCLLSILSSKNQFFFVFGTLVPCLCFMFMCLFIFDVLVFFCVCYINIFVFQCFQFVSWCLFCFSWGFFFLEVCCVYVYISWLYIYVMAFMSLENLLFVFDVYVFMFRVCWNRCVVASSFILCLMCCMILSLWEKGMTCNSLQVNVFLWTWVLSVKFHELQ
jgi:hypothetical protein